MILRTLLAVTASLCLIAGSSQADEKKPDGARAAEKKPAEKKVDDDRSEKRKARSAKQRSRDGRRSRPNRQRMVTRLFERADSDGDGSLNQKEFTAAMKRFHNRADGRNRDARNGRGARQGRPMGYGRPMGPPPWWRSSDSGYRWGSRRPSGWDDRRPPFSRRFDDRQRDRDRGDRQRADRRRAEEKKTDSADKADQTEEKKSRERPAKRKLQEERREAKT